MHLACTTLTCSTGTCFTSSFGADSVRDVSSSWAKPVSVFIWNNYYIKLISELWMGIVLGNKSGYCRNFTLFFFQGSFRDFSFFSFFKSKRNIIIKESTAVISQTFHWIKSLWYRIETFEFYCLHGGGGYLVLSSQYLQKIT